MEEGVHPDHGAAWLPQGLQQVLGRVAAGTLAAAVLFGSGVAAPPPASAVLNSPNARIPRRWACSATAFLPGV